MNIFNPKQVNNAFVIRCRIYKIKLINMLSTIFKRGNAMRPNIIFLIPVLLFISLFFSSCTGETDYDSMFHNPEAHDKIMTQMMDNEDWRHDYIDKMMERDDTRQYMMEQMFDHVQSDSSMMKEMYDMMAQYPTMMKHMQNYMQSGNMMGNQTMDGGMMGRDKK
jgi:hypothetical protein